MLNSTIPRPTSENPIWIIIPIYNQPTLVEQCIASVLAARCDTPFKLCLVDDASSDARIGRILNKYQTDPRIKCIRKETNSGFTKTANEGIRAAGSCHPLLLNSDTIVYDHWLDEMVDALFSHPKTGSVTPMTNQGGSHLTCYPDAPPSKLPTIDDEEKAIAAAAYDVCRGVVGRIHSGVGFCLLLNRECLDEVGGLDEVTFPRGYFEETDLCLRASYLGWQHLAAGGCFVTHLRGQSFGSEKAKLMKTMFPIFRALHPSQPAVSKGFIERDPLRAVRRQIDLGRLKQHLDGNAVISVVPSNQRHFPDLPYLQIDDDCRTGPRLHLRSKKTKFPNVDPYDVVRDLAQLRNDLGIAGIKEIALDENLGFDGRGLRDLFRNEDGKSLSVHDG